MNKSNPNENLLRVIDKALEDQGISAREASIRATGTAELIRNMRRGRVPSVERFQALCNVLKLEFYVGPTRIQSSTSTYPSAKKDDVYHLLQEIISRLPPTSTRIKTAEPAKPYGRSQADDIYHIPIAEIDTVDKATAAGSSIQAKSYVAFQSSWLSTHNLDPKHCIMLQVCDKSMQPTIPNEAVVLIDRSRSRRRVGHIYAIRTDDDLVIRRLSKDKSKWLLVGDNPKYGPTPFPESAVIIGEVKWMATTFE